MNINATLFVQIAVFVALWWFTAKFVWPPIVKSLDERSKRIAEANLSLARPGSTTHGSSSGGRTPTATSASSASFAGLDIAGAACGAGSVVDARYALQVGWRNAGRVRLFRPRAVGLRPSRTLGHPTLVPYAGLDGPPHQRRGASAG